MTTRRALLTVCATLLTIAMTAQVGRTHSPGFSLAGIGTATLDGILTPGEWTLAGAATFNANAPDFDGGGTFPITMYVMNDATTLYIGFELPRPAGLGINPILFFDRNHDGAREQGDDEFGGAVGQFNLPGTFIDAYVFDGPTLNSRRDTDDGGTNDGVTAGSTTATSTFIEMSHPLASGDPHDFSLAPGDVIGFGGLMNLFSVDVTCTPNEIGSPCQRFTDFAGSRSQPLGDIAITEVTAGSCHAAAAEARRLFVAACVAAGGSRPSCNAAGNEIMIARMASCP